MARVCTFSATSQQEHEIRQVAIILFDGGNVLSQPETAELFWKYKTLIDMFLVAVDKKTGNLIHLPFNVDLYYQPSKTMSFFRILQNLWVERVVSKNPSLF